MKKFKLTLSVLIGIICFSVVFQSAAEAKTRTRSKGRSSSAARNNPKVGENLLKNAGFSACRKADGGGYYRAPNWQRGLKKAPPVPAEYKSMIDNSKDARWKNCDYVIGFYAYFFDAYPDQKRKMKREDKRRVINTIWDVLQKMISALHGNPLPPGGYEDLYDRLAGIRHPLCDELGTCNGERSIGKTTKNDGQKYIVQSGPNGTSKGTGVKEKEEEVKKKISDGVGGGKGEKPGEKGGHGKGPGGGDGKGGIPGGDPNGVQGGSPYGVPGGTLPARDDVIFYNKYMVFDEGSIMKEMDPSEAFYL